MKRFIFYGMLLVVSLPVLSGMQEPPDFGKIKTFEEYSNIFEATPDLHQSNRRKSIISTCQKELKDAGEQCVEVKDKTFPCNDKGVIISGDISFCSSVVNEDLTISKTLKIKFYPSGRDKSNYNPKLKKMFYSAVNCMKAVYRKQGITLDIQFKEVWSYKEADIRIVDRAKLSPNLHLIPMGSFREYYSHELLCQIVTHEISHHLGLPDRYQMSFGGKTCDQQTVYPQGTLMSSNPFRDSLALKLHEDDVLDLFYESCPKTVNYFDNNPDIDSVENLDFLEEEPNLIDRILEFISKLNS